MLHEAREEPVGPHGRILQFPANQVRSQSFPRSRFQGYAYYIEREWTHQNHAKVPATSLTLETEMQLQKDMRQYFKSHMKSCSSSESLWSLPSQQPEECSEDLSPDESYSDFEDYAVTMMNYQSNSADLHPKTLSDAKYLSLQIGRRGNQLCNTIFKFNSFPGKFVLSK